MSVRLSPALERALFSRIREAGDVAARAALAARDWQAEALGDARRRWESTGTGPRPGWANDLIIDAARRRITVAAHAAARSSIIGPVREVAAEDLAQLAGLDADHDRISDTAAELRETASLIGRTGGPAAALQWAGGLIGRDVPGDSLDSQLRRVLDPVWWRGRVRRAVRRAREITWLHASPLDIKWTSPDGLAEARSQDASADTFRERYQAIADDGSSCDLPSREQAQKRQYAELLARAKGIAETADAAGCNDARLVTITAPGHMHPTTSQGGQRRSNPDWDGSTPADVAAWMNEKWGSMRRSAKKADIEWYWIRAAQPHADETPHWHLIIWAAPGDWDGIESRLRHRFIGEDADEARQLRGLQIDPVRGGSAGAVGYIARVVSYIARVTAEGKDADEAERATAWSRTWGIRRFQTSHDRVTVWRQLRKKDLSTGGIKAAADAARSGDYAGFLREAARLDLRPAYRETEGRYGDPARRLVGVRSGDVTWTRARTWRLERRPSPAAEVAGDTVIVEGPRAPLRGAGDPPMTDWSDPSEQYWPPPAPAWRQPPPPAPHPDPTAEQEENPLAPTPWEQERDRQEAGDRAWERERRKRRHAVVAA